MPLGVIGSPPYAPPHSPTHRAAVDPQACERERAIHRPAVRAKPCAFAKTFPPPVARTSSPRSVRRPCEPADLADAVVSVRLGGVRPLEPPPAYYAAALLREPAARTLPPAALRNRPCPPLNGPPFSLLPFSQPRPKDRKLSDYILRGPELEANSFMQSLRASTARRQAVRNQADRMRFSPDPSGGSHRTFLPALFFAHLFPLPANP
jgi:hypothetical protein